MGLHLSLPGRLGFTRNQGSHHSGGGWAIQDTRGLITGKGRGAIEDIRGLITVKVGLYKILGVLSLPGRSDYTRYQWSHHWGGGIYEGTMTSPCNTATNALV